MKHPQRKSRATVIALLEENSRLKSEIAKLTKALKINEEAYNNGFMLAHAQAMKILHLEQMVEETTWTLVTDQNPIQLGDELLTIPKIIPNPWYDDVSTVTEFDIRNKRIPVVGTYRRRINAPAEFGAEEKKILKEIYEDEK